MCILFGYKYAYKLGNNLSQDPAIPLLGIYPNDAQSYHKDMYSIMFIVALFMNTEPENNLGVPLPKNGLRKCGTWIYIGRRK